MKLNVSILIIIFLFVTNKSIAQNQRTINYDSLKVVLDSVHYYDQYFYNSGLKEKATHTAEESLLIEKIEKRHIQNLVIVTDILDKYGWLGKEEVGVIATNALWLTIQHNDIATQVKYLPMLKKAAKNGKAFLADVAMLEDRMAIKLGKKQVYGSQLPPHPITGKSTVWPIENPEKVDERRAKIGLPSMADYVSFWDLEWSLKEHIEMIEEFDKKKLLGFYMEKD